MTSAALSDLGARLDEVRILAAQDPSRINPSAVSPLSGPVNRASLVLLTAHLEGFLEDLVTECLDNMVTNSPEVENLPLLLRAIHV